MKVRLQYDDEILTGSSPRAIVTLMRNTAMMPGTSEAEWIRDSARNASMILERHVSGDDPDSYFRDLVAAGYITILEE